MPKNTDSVPDLQVEFRDIVSIKPYEKNPRLNDKAPETVAASLKEFGFRQPVVVDYDSVIRIAWERLLQFNKTKDFNMYQDAVMGTYFCD